MNHWPNSLEAEKTVLSFLLNNFRSTINLTSDYFFHELNKSIYISIVTLQSQGKPLESGIVDDCLLTNIEYTTKNGYQYLQSLYPIAKEIQNSFEYYLDILQRHYIDRQLLKNYSKSQFALMEQKDGYRDELSKHHQLIDELYLLRDKSQIVEIDKLTDFSIKSVYDRSKIDGQIIGIPTGISKLDDLMLGMQKSDFTIIGARPSVGKSSLLTSVLASIIIRSPSTVVPVFSLEMSPDQLINRIAATIGHVPLQKIRSGKLSNLEWGRYLLSAEIIKKSKIIIPDIDNITVGEIESFLRNVFNKYGSLDLVKIDYLQLIKSIVKNQQRVNEISQITRDLKLLAKKLKIPLVVLSQLSRESERRSNSDRRPKLSDLRDGGSSEQDADNVIFIHREEMYNQDPQNRGIAELILSKQRNGPVGTIYTGFLQEYTKFENIAY